MDRPWIGKAEAWGRKLIYAAFSSVFKEKVPGAFDLGNVGKILLIKEPYRMGDLFQVTPTLRALKSWKNDLRVGLVIQDRNLPLFRDNSRVDEIFVYRKRAFNRRPWELLAFFRDLRKSKFDLAVTLETQRTHLTNDLIARLSGAPFRLRYGGEAFGNPESDAFYNLIVPFDGSARHQVDKNFGVFRHYGLELLDRSLEFHVSETDQRSAEEMLKRLSASSGLARGSRVHVIHPGSYKLANRWPLENYLRVGNALKEKGKLVAFVLGPSEQNWRADIEKAGFPVVAGITIGEMAGIFRTAGEVLCNDTGVMHIAGAVGARTLALFGETDPEQWKPPGDSVRHLASADRKITSIPAEEVLAELT